jgi:hypothetical protein
MRIQPRQQLLDVWRAVAATSYPNGAWRWGGRHGRNSISDAEQLLCLMGPVAELPSVKLDVPDETAEDVQEALRRLGSNIEIPQRLTTAILDYLTTYADDTGTPTFAGSSYFSTDGAEPLPAQLDLDVVDSFSASVRLTLFTIGFARVFRRVLSRRDLLDRVTEMEELASKRLTAAMIGLLRSFSINVFDEDSAEGGILLRMLNRGRPPNHRLLADLRTELRQVRAGLRDLTLGHGEIPDLDDEKKLFECGWAWGVVRGAAEIETSADVGAQRAGVAPFLPWLYFTVVALDSIEDLFSERTRLLNLLDDEQQRLARALQLRWDLTQSYWSTIARFGGGERWPLEDMPWRTTDDQESDYLTLLITSIVVKDLSRPQASDLDNDVARAGDVVRELATRARVTRRPVAADFALSLHQPGFPVELDGSDDLPDGAAGTKGPLLTWKLSDFSAQLLKQALRLAGLAQGIQLRADLKELADQIWEHLLLRRDRSPGDQLWDQPSRVYPQLEPVPAEVSWYYTERVVSCLVTAAQFLRQPPQRSNLLRQQATETLAEADHLFDQELLNESAEAGPEMRRTFQALRSQLRRAYDVLDETPGTAAALGQDVLIQLDRLRLARQRASEVG